MTKLADSFAILDNLLEGKALPTHLSRNPAGQVISAKAKPDDVAVMARQFNDAIAKAAAEKMRKSPLLAVCHRHTCRCGNKWEAFGFYARQVTERIEGEADATFTKRLDYDPRPETVKDVVWHEVEEQACLKCFMGVGHA